MAYVVEHISGDDMLKRKWNVGDAIIYNSDPEDTGHEHLHLSQCIIGNVYKDNDEHMILIRFLYGSIKKPLRNISVQITPDVGCTTFFVYGTLRDDDNSGGLEHKMEGCINTDCTKKEQAIIHLPSIRTINLITLMEDSSHLRQETHFNNFVEICYKICFQGF
eukprot:7252_1